MNVFLKIQEIIFEQIEINNYLIIYEVNNVLKHFIMTHIKIILINIERYIEVHD